MDARLHSNLLSELAQPWVLDYQAALLLAGLLRSSALGASEPRLGRVHTMNAMIAFATLH
jgi:hypothetical protein